MNDHNLDDLIIDNIGPKNTRTKSFLTIIALLIVVLIVAIILTKIMLKDPNADKIAFEENNTELVSPELTLKSAAEPKPAKSRPELSNIIENALNAPDFAEEVAKETVEEVAEEVVTVPEEPEVTTEVEEERIEIPEKKEVQKAVKPALRQSVEKAKVRPTGKPVNVPAPKPISSQTYYIQVGSFKQTPSPRFLSIIKNSGFNYKITSPAGSETKKLLIGPYEDRRSVDAALVKVKDRINKSAFVVKK